jgi:quercetin dioxygenase-like cupin family protein
MWKVVQAKHCKWTFSTGPLRFSFSRQKERTVNPLRAWAVVVVLASCAALAFDRSAPPATRVAFSHALPQLDTGRLRISVVEVAYRPGGSSLPHSHPCPVIGYVVQGSIRTQVKGEPEATYQAGEAFYEAPNGTHLVSANASANEPAKLVAFFVCDHEAPLSGTPTQAGASGGRTP